jgi:hypothetical protein
MKRNVALVLVVIVSAGVLTGCVGTVDGRHRVGMPLVNDRIQATYERAPQEIWTAAKDVIAYNGVLTSEDVLKATLEGAVDARKVWVKVEPVDTKVTRVVVQVRTKAGAPDVALAGEIDKQIALRLATGNLTPAQPTTAAAK